MADSADSWFEAAIASIAYVLSMFCTFSFDQLCSLLNLSAN